MVQSASEPCQESVVTSRNFSMLLEQAGEKCDLLMIAAPPVVIAADALYLGRQADFVLHVVRWNSTLVALYPRTPSPAEFRHSDRWR